ncbi:MAG TPA: hypothetical protein VLF40_05700 [Candidatus Saccharimonadales bacterium]|nr:hypothetical protein [Candidatus Saccharimonadales bacterium]
MFHTRKKLKIKKGAWFVAIRGSYIPVSWQGWLTYLPFTAYLVFAVLMGWQLAEGSPSRAILFVVPNWVAAVAIMTWLAKRTS